MTKITKKIVDDPSQMSLFELLSQKKTECAAVQPGRKCVSAQLMASARVAIKAVPKSRETLADDMTNLTGQEVTVHMINSWCADSHPHRLPAEFLPALCEATGSIEPIRILAEASGLFTVQGPDALRADMQRDVERKRELDRQIRQKEALIKALEVER